MQNPDIISLLLSFNANPNAKDFEGSTPLHIAADGNNIECVRLLIEAGANPNLRNEFGTKSIDLIKKRGFQSVLNTPVKKIL